MRAVVVKEFRELLRDHRTLAMLVVLPVLLLVIFGYAANFSVDEVSTTVIGSDADELAEELAGYAAVEDGIDIVATTPSADDPEPILRAQDSDTVIATVEGASPDAPLNERMRVYVDGSSLFHAQAAQRTFARLVAEDAERRAAALQEDMSGVQAEAQTFRAQLDEFSASIAALRTAAETSAATGAPLGPLPDLAVPELPELPELPAMSETSLDGTTLITVLFNPDLKTSWVMIPGLIGLILTFIGTVITSIGLVRERESGTLEQLAVMPLRPVSIILGKITPYFLLAVLDMGLITLLGTWLFDVPFVGSAWLFGLAALVFLFVVLGTGVLISSLSQNTGQAIQLAIMVVLPQVLLSGLIFPLESMAAGVRWIGYALPLTWFNQVAQGIMLRGAGIDTLWAPLLVLAGLSVVIFGAATAKMGHSLAHGGTR